MHVPDVLTTRLLQTGENHRELLDLLCTLEEDHLLLIIDVLDNFSILEFPTKSMNKNILMNNEL